MPGFAAATQARYLRPTDPTLAAKAGEHGATISRAARQTPAPKHPSPIKAWTLTSAAERVVAKAVGLASRIVLEGGQAIVALAVRAVLHRHDLLHH